MSTHLLAVSRRKTILEHVRLHSEVPVALLADALSTPAATLRRDLRLLEAQGVIRRSYGMITAVETSRYEKPLADRELSYGSEKSSIADAAVGLLDDEASIYIDEGYLPHLIAVRLPSDKTFTVVTPSLPVAAYLAENTHNDVYLLGGRVRGRTLGAVDYWARDMLSGFSLDIGFIGANGVTVDGLTTPDPAVGAIKSMAVSVCKRRVFIGDHTKFGVTTFSKFAAVSDFELFVTSDKLPISQTRRFTQIGAQFLRAATTRGEQ